jgi:alkylhydroperoxidase family enzyme
MARLVGDERRSGAIRQALELRQPENAFEGAELAGLRYASKLTLAADDVSANDIESMRRAGLDDGQILEINQVTAYFGYANRTVLGLGISTKGDIIGLSPGDSNDPDNWSHE